LFNHFRDSFGHLIGHQIRYPDDTTLFVAVREYLYGCVMMSERRAASRPSVAAGFIIDRDNEFPYDHAVRKRYGSPLTL